MEGTVDMVNWLGIHYLRIKNTLGTFDPSPTAKGNNGLYETTYSETIRLVILDPCRNSTVNEDQGLSLTEINVPSGKPFLKDVY